jgi:TIGR03009 family protein
MRHTSLALLALLAAASTTLAQQGSPPPTGTPEQLNEQLGRWEKEMAATKSISARCSRTDVNRVRNENRILSGYVKCMKADAGNGKTEKLAVLHLAEKDKPESFEKFVCTGSLAYWFAPQEKAIYVKRLGGKMGEDNFLNFLFEMKADALKKRYDMTLIRPDDPNYIYIEIKPRQEADKVEFQRARLVLFKATCLPCQLWFEEPNGNHHTWDMSEIKVNDAGVKPADFVAPEKPAGWQIKEAKDKEPESKPAVIRPSRP